MNDIIPRDEVRVDRRSIRQAIVERLRELHLPYGARVFSNRQIPVSIRQLPAVAVYTLREEISIWTESPRRYKRELELVIEILAGVPPPVDGAVDIAQASDGLDDQIDGIVLEIESRLERDQTLSGLVHDVSHKRYEYEPVDQGERRMAFARLIETVVYSTEAGERPESGFPPLRVVQSRLGRPGSPDQALHDVHQINR